MNEEKLIARLWTYPEMVGAFREPLRKVSFQNLLGEIIDSFVESYDLFGTVRTEFLKDKFVDRPDVDLIMQRAAEVNLESEDANFSRYWVGNYLAKAVSTSVDHTRDTVQRMREKIILAEEFEKIARGSGTGSVAVWDFIETSEARLQYRELDRYVLRTGIPRLDEQVKMSDGTVTLFMAPWKKYKSITLINMGAVALAQGLNVFHLHYEGKRTQWESRYDSCLTGISKDRLYQGMTESELRKYRKVYQTIRNRGTMLHFMSGIPGGTGVIEIENELDNLARQGKNFQVIIVDYLNLLRPSQKKSDSDWQEQGVLAWDLVRLSQLGYIVVSAIQTTREGAERDILRPADLGRSVVIAQAVTNIIAINQTEAERPQGKMRLGPVALRDSEVTSSQVELNMALWKMRISDDINRVLDRLVEDEPGNINI